MTDNDPAFKGFNSDQPLPTWLQKPPKSQRTGWVAPQPQPQSQTQAAAQPAPAVVHHETVRTVVQGSKGSTKATAGILIIATLMAASFWFSAALVASVAISPPDTVIVSGLGVEEDVWTFGRMLFATLAAIVLTGATWVVAIVIAEE